MLLSALLAMALAGPGGSVSGGRPPAVDMVASGYSDSLPNPIHLGHWPSPTPGVATALTINSTGAGVGPGLVTFSVLVETVGTVCTLEAACTFAPGDYATVACPATTIPAEVVVHLVFSHTCTTAPSGTLVASFEWHR